MSHAPMYADFGPEIDHLLNRLGWYLKDRGATAAEGEVMINAGIAAYSSLEHLMGKTPAPSIGGGRDPEPVSAAPGSC